MLSFPIKLKSALCQAACLGTCLALSALNIPSEAAAQTASLSQRLSQQTQWLALVQKWTRQFPHWEIRTEQIVLKADPIQAQQTGKAVLEQDNLGIRLQFLDRVFFDFNQQNLTNDAHMLLSTFAQLVRQLPSTGTQPAVLITGHTDSKGADRYNWTLGEKRAGLVARYLAQAGLSPSQISVFSLGEGRPMTSNQTENGRAANRRIEIFLGHSAIALAQAALTRPFNRLHLNNHEYPQGQNRPNQVPLRILGVTQEQTLYDSGIYYQF